MYIGSNNHDNILGSYSKSLRLLGLNIPSNRREATKLENIDVEVRTSSPTMRTRLIKRTKSISDLRDKVKWNNYGYISPSIN